MQRSANIRVSLATACPSVAETQGRIRHKGPKARADALTYIIILEYMESAFEITAKPAVIARNPISVGVTPWIFG